MFCSPLQCEPWPFRMRFAFLLSTAPDSFSDTAFLVATKVQRPAPYLFHSFLHIFHSVGSDKRMKGFILTRQHLAIFPPHLPFFHRTFASDHDLCVALFLNVLQCVSSGRTKCKPGCQPINALKCIPKKRNYPEGRKSSTLHTRVVILGVTPVSF